MTTMAIEVLKILNETCPPVLDNLVEKRSSSYNFRHSNLFAGPDSAHQYIWQEIF